MRISPAAAPVKHLLLPRPCCIDRVCRLCHVSSHHGFVLSTSCQLPRRAGTGPTTKAACRPWSPQKQPSNTHLDGCAQAPGRSQHSTGRQQAHTPPQSSSLQHAPLESGGLLCAHAAQQRHTTQSACALLLQRQRQRVPRCHTNAQRITRAHTGVIITNSITASVSQQALDQQINITQLCTAEPETHIGGAQTHTLNRHRLLQAARAHQTAQVHQ